MKFKILIVLLGTLLYLEAGTSIKSIKEIRQANQGLTYLKMKQNQTLKKVTLKKYYLFTHMEEPFLFGNKDEVYNLYLTAFLEKSQPLWLENDIFVFHTASSKKYLKKLQKLYARKYKIDLEIEKNKEVNKKKFTRRSVDTKELSRYLDMKSSVYLAQKNESKNKKNFTKKASKQNKITTTNETEDATVVPAKIRSKKDIYLAEKAIKSLRNHKENSSVKLSKHILYTRVDSPFIFFSKEHIYNLYLSAILNEGNPKWLEDTKFVMHMSSNRSYLKRLQKFYKRKYNLELTLGNNSAYKKHKSALMSVVMDDVISYIDENFPQSYKDKHEEKLLLEEKKRIAQEEKKKREEAKRKKLEEKKTERNKVVEAKISSKKEALRVKKGIYKLKSQVCHEVKALKFKKYFLGKKVEEPSFFESMEPIYNLYLTALLYNGKPVWLEDERFIFHTSSSYLSLKKLKKFYKKRYNLNLTIYNNDRYNRKMFPLMDKSISSVIEYLKEKRQRY